MSSASRQLSTSVRSRTRPLISAACSATRASRYYHAAMPGTRRILGPVTIVPRTAVRGYRLKSGDEELSEESRKNLDDETKLKLGKSKSLDPHCTFPLPAQANEFPQLSPSSKTAYRRSSSSRSPPKFSRPTSLFTSFRRPTRTFPLRTAELPTRPRFGPPPSLGTASP